MDNLLEQSWDELEDLYRSYYETLREVQTWTTGSSGGRATALEVLQHFFEHIGLHWRTKDGYYIVVTPVDTGYRFDVASKMSHQSEFQYNPLFNSANKVNLTVEQLFVTFACFAERDDTPFQIIGYNSSDEVRLNLNYIETLQDHHQELSINDLIERECVISKYIRDEKVIEV